MSETEETRVGHLDTVGGVATELGRLYRAARKGKIAVADASKLATVLAVLRQCLETCEIERRVNELEAVAVERGGHSRLQ